MKLKIFIIITVMLIAGITAVTLLVRPRAPRLKFAPEQQWQEAISNYSKTFTLNTNPPLWPEAKGVTDAIR
jgi:hypothetical protein